MVSFLQYISTVSQEIEKKQGLQWSENIWCLVAWFLCWSGQGDIKPSVTKQDFTQPRCARRRSDCITLVFFPVGSWHETIGKSLMPLYFFRVVSLDSLWLCSWEYTTGIFWDERCCVSAICCFCLNLFLSTGIYTGVINRLNCPNRDSSPLLLQNTCCIPVATAYTAMLQLVQSVFH